MQIKRKIKGNYEDCSKIVDRKFGQFKYLYALSLLSLSLRISSLLIFL